MDDIITAYECLHFMKRETFKTNSYCALNLDMMKPYDRLDWSYLHVMTSKLGFAHAWVETGLGMVKFVPLLVMFNGEILKNSNPQDVFDREILFPLIFF